MRFNNLRGTGVAAREGGRLKPRLKGRWPQNPLSRVADSPASTQFALGIQLSPARAGGLRGCAEAQPLGAASAASRRSRIPGIPPTHVGVLTRALAYGIVLQT